MSRGVIVRWALTLLLLGAVHGAAQAEKRIALVVGNDQYANLPPDQQLRRAVNDARAVGEVLGRLGFTVLRGENLNRQALNDKFDEMAGQLSPGDTAFFFFAGHGVSIGGGNYILPTDVPNVTPGQEARLARAALGENEIVSDLQGRGVRVAVVVLDACRNNPFKRPGTRAAGGERGLVRSDPVRGVFSLYSAGVGQTALDRLGDGDNNANSVFTRVLVPALGKPGLDLSALAIEIREEVARLAGTIGHDQRPAYYDETIGGRIYLAGLPPAAAQTPGGTTQPVAEAERAWAATKDTTSIAVLEEFVRRYADSYYAVLARARIAELGRNQLAAVPPPAAPLTVPSPPSAPSAGALIREFKHPDDVKAAVFSPDGQRALTASSDRILRLWDSASAALIRELKGHTASIEAIAFSPDGRRILSGSEDSTVRLWDAASGTLIRQFKGHADGVLAVTFSPDGRFVLSGGRDKILRLWDTATGASIREIKGHALAIWSVAFSPDGRAIVSGGEDKALRLWETASGRMIREFNGHTDQINAVVFSPTGSRILSGSNDKTLRLWDVSSGAQVRRLEGHSDHVTAVAFSPDGRYVLSGANDKTMRLWDAVASALIREWQHDDAVWAVAFSPDGRSILSGSPDKTARIWDARLGSGTAGTR
jgi:uncharacterized protein YjiK